MLKNVHPKILPIFTRPILQTHRILLKVWNNINVSNNAFSVLGDLSLNRILIKNEKRVLMMKETHKGYFAQTRVHFLSRRGAKNILHHGDA